jgi:tetratricopeptide (TPR) repeat protein
LTVGLVGAAAALAVLAGGGWLRVEHDRAERNRLVHAELEQVASLREQAREASPERRRSLAAEALAAAQRADGLLAQGVADEALGQRVRQLVADLREEERDRQMLTKLEEARLARTMLKGDFLDQDASDKAYAQAFRWYGVDVEQLDLTEAANRLRARPIRVELAAALDDWPMPKTKAALKIRLARLARLVDPDPDRNGLRDALEKGDRRALVKMARSSEAAFLPPPTLVLLGVALFHQEAEKEAVALFRQAQRRHPDDFWINHELAWCLLSMKSPRTEEAIRFFTAAVALRNQTPATHDHLALALLKKGDIDGVLTASEDALRLHRDDYAALNNIAAALIETNPDGAIAACRKALRFKKDSPVIYTNLGTALHRKRDYDGATTAFRKALRLDKNFAEAHNYLGTALENKGLLEKAIASYREAIRLNRDRDLPHYNFGLALIKKNDLDGAAAAFREAIGVNEDEVNFHRGLSIVLVKQGKIEGDIAAFRRILQLKHDDAEAYNNLGAALLEYSQDTDVAIHMFMEAIRFNKDYPEALANLGAAWTKAGDPDRALAALRKAINLDKNYAEAYRNLGHALEMKGDWDGAIAHYRQAIRLKKDYCEAFVDLGIAVGRKGDLDQTISLFREAIRLRKDYAPAHSGLGTALAQKGKLDEGIAAKREAIRLRKDDFLAHFHLGDYLMQKGQPDQAIAAFQEAIRLRNDFAEAHCYLGQALTQKGQFVQALRALRRGHELGSKRLQWPYPSVQWVKECQRLVELDARLPDILGGKKQPADAADRAALAKVCCLKRLHQQAAIFYEKAFAGQSSLAADLEKGHRYEAACAAALVGVGQAKDAAKLDAPQRTRWRKQALDWLCADLAL